MIVKGNFLCNKVAGKAGDVLSKDQLAQIGDQLPGLIKAGLVEAAKELPVASVPEEAPAQDEPVLEVSQDEGKKKRSRKKSE